MAATAPPGVTDDEIARMREFVGVPLRTELWNDQVTHDTIKHFCWGFGDDNPLWLDDEYARGARYGTRVAPPTFIFSVSEGAAVKGLSPDIQPLNGGAKMWFARPLEIGEWVTVDIHLAAVEVLDGRAAGRMARQTARAIYSVEGKEVARADSRFMCIKAPDEGNAGAYEAREPHVYPADELARIREGALGEIRRGAEPLLWDAVQVADVLPQVVKGPLNLMDMTCWSAGAIGPASVRGVETRVRMQERIRTGDPTAPNNLDTDHLLATKAAGGAGHQDAEAARRSGLPGVYDFGPQRMSWVAHCVTNWMGDDADLIELDVQLRRPNVFGDTQWIGGTVARKFVTDDGMYVELALTAVNQLGETTTTGQAIVRCPS